MSGRGRSLYSLGRTRSGLLVVGATPEVLGELVIVLVSPCIPTGPYPKDLNYLQLTSPSTTSLEEECSEFVTK
jgi:hypothetical protein